MIFILSFYNEWNESMWYWSRGTAITGALISAIPSFHSLSLSLCTCVFFHMRSLTVGVGNWSWVSQSEQQKCNIQSWKYNNYRVVRSTCVHNHIFITLLMCQLLKYNETIIIISISFFLTRLLWNSVVQDQCQI